MKLILSLSMECSSMVSIATFGLMGSNPGWLLSQIQIENWVNTQIIQAYDQAMPNVITVTVSSLVGGDK